MRHALWALLEVVFLAGSGLSGQTAELSRSWSALKPIEAARGAGGAAEQLAPAETVDTAAETGGARRFAAVPPSPFLIPVSLVAGSGLTAWSPAAGRGRVARAETPPPFGALFLGATAGSALGAAVGVLAGAQVSCTGEDCSLGHALLGGMVGSAAGAGAGSAAVLALYHHPPAVAAAAGPAALAGGFACAGLAGGMGARGTDLLVAWIVGQGLAAAMAVSALGP